MNTPKKNLTLAALWFLIACVPGHASHNRGGHISYRRVAPFVKVVGTVTVPVYNYSITVTKYHNTGQSAAVRCVDTVRFGDGSSGVAPRINGAVCNDCGSSIGCGAPLPGPYTGIVSIYATVHEYPGPGVFFIRSSDPNRNFDIDNIPNSGLVPFTIESKLVISESPNQQSAKINSIDLGYGNVGSCYQHFLNATDDDGDSLSFEVTANRGYNGAPVPGYQFPSSGYQFNGGVLEWCSPQKIGVYALACIVHEWRKNSSGVDTEVGNTLVDIELIVGPPVGFGELEKNIDLYYDPANRLISVNCGGSGTNHIELLTLGGSRVRMADLECGEKLDVGGMAQGVYLVRLRNGDEFAVKKFVVE